MDVAKSSRTPAELALEVGGNLRTLRLLRDIDQKTLAERAGVSVRALKNLEGGAGSTLHTLICVVRALGQEDWLRAIAPVATVNPLAMTRQAAPRLRASRRPSASRG